MQYWSIFICGDNQWINGQIFRIILFNSYTIVIQSKAMYDSLWPHEIRLPYPLLSPWVCSNSCPLSQWCHPTISSSVTSFSCPQSFPASGSFPKSWLFASGGQSIGVSFSFSISPSNEYSGFISFRIDWFDLLAIQGTLKSLLQHHSSKTSILQHSAFFMIKLLLPNVTTGKAIALTIRTIDGKVTFCFLICCLGLS